LNSSSISIAWIISAYQKPEQLIHIIERIAVGNDSVWLHYDRKSPSSELDIVRAHFKNNSKVHCFQKYSVFWGGIQSVWVDLFLAKQLLKSQLNYDYVVHLTGSTYPIKSDESLRSFLLSHYGKTFLQLDPDEAIHELGSDRSRFYAKEHFGIFPGRNFPKYNFVMKLRYKINLKFLRFIKRLGLYRKNFSLPTSFPNVYRGFVQNVIFKDHYLAGLNDKRSRKLLRELKYTSSPDEVFFNTLMANTVSPDELVTNNNLLFTYWRKSSASPDTLKESDLETLFISDRFFARKFESLSLIQSVDQHINAADKEKFSADSI